MNLDEFIAKWEGHPGGAEKSNFAPFIADLCEILAVDRPGQSEKGKIGAYEYEASVPGGSLRSLDGTGAIDLYKRGHFIMEAKQSYLKPDQTALDLGEPPPTRAPSGARYDKLMRNARLQAENYAKNLPGGEPVAPFVIVCDVGRAFEIYLDGAGNGRGYSFFPDKQSYRFAIGDLARDAHIGTTGKTARELLHAIWTAPRSIDPRFQSADVTRVVAKNLASVSQYLESGIKARGLNPHDKAIEVEEASLFLMRILFCMFAEDIGLLPEDRFKDFLKRAESNDQLFETGLRDLFQKMGAPNIEPRFTLALESNVRYFNGGLFENDKTYPLGGFVIHDLYEAARQNWRKVEPAIFGTLLEQALTAEERAKLGAHYTPRPYVETLVRATIIDVLEPEWEAIEEAIGAVVEQDETADRHPSPSGEGPGVGQSGEIGRASTPPPLTPPLKGRGTDAALDLARVFHDRLAALRILDPACGTGNFLYVAMELLQALEARVIERIETLGGHAEPRVGPHQFHGLELNPRAAKIAELVLWIGWLRNRLRDDPDAIPEPVLARSANINFGRHGRYDAVLKLTETGDPDFASPSLPAWPEADFIIGNPPFIGGKDLRDRLGSDYAEALWKANPRVPKSADFVMQWWDRAAHTLVAKNSPLIRFGFVTTNSITQEFSRRVIANYLSPSPSGEGEGVGPPPDTLSLVMAIPDHPWTKATKDAAAVRIAMTVAQRGAGEGMLREVISEGKLSSDDPDIALVGMQGRINSNLTVGADVTSAIPLLANEGLASPGVKLHGSGFIVSEQKARADLGLGSRKGLEKHIRPYRNGRDLLQKSRDVMVIDLFGLDEKQVRQRFPEVYEYLLRTVWDYEVRDKKTGEIKRDGRRYNRRDYRRENWWLFGENNPRARDSWSGLNGLLVTPETAKHRIFFLENSDTLQDNANWVIALDESFVFGVLQSRLSTDWILRAGGTLESRPKYTKTNCFDPFPFPDASPKQRTAIAELAEELDETRKIAIAETDRLTMTELYNLREKLRSGEPLSDKDQRRATKARAGIVDRLHDQLDAAVADAYGWGHDWRAGTLGPSEIVARLVALNAARAAEEAEGNIRWLRPDYQIPRFAPKP